MVRKARFAFALMLAMGLPGCNPLNPLTEVACLFTAAITRCLPAAVEGTTALRAEEAILCCGEQRTFDFESAHDALLLAELQWRDENVDLQLASEPDYSGAACSRRPPRTRTSRGLCIFVDRGEAVQVIVQGDASAEAQPYNLDAYVPFTGGLRAAR